MMILKFVVKYGSIWFGFDFSKCCSNLLLCISIEKWINVFNSLLSVDGICVIFFLMMIMCCCKLCSIMVLKSWFFLLKWWYKVVCFMLVCLVIFFIVVWRKLNLIYREWVLFRIFWLVVFLFFFNKIDGIFRFMVNSIFLFLLG